MKKVLSLFILLLPLSGFAQKRSAIGETCPPNCQTSLIIKTSAISPVLMQPGLRLGLEIPFDSFCSIEPMLGYYYHYSKGVTRMDKSNISFDVKSTFKYYIPRATLLGLYTGPVFSYARSYYDEGKYDLRQEYNPQTGTLDDVPFINYDNATKITQDGYSLLWQAGLQPILVRHLALDVFIGAGVQKLNFKSYTPPNSNSGKSIGTTVHTTSTQFTTLIGCNLGYAF